MAFNDSQEKIAYYIIILLDLWIVNGYLLLHQQNVLFNWLTIL